MRRPIKKKLRAKADSRYNSERLEKFINNIMLDGRKETARKVVYGALDEISPWPHYAMTMISMNLSNPVNQYANPSEYVMYYGGAAFYPDVGQEMHVAATYDDFYDEPAIIQFEYGIGRVLLYGPHPEIEEDSARDNVAFADDLSDNF